MKSFFCSIVALFACGLYASDFNNNDIDLLFHHIGKQELKKVKRLMSAKNIRPDVFCAVKRMTPLGYAAQIGNASVFKCLLKRSYHAHERINEIGEEELNALEIARKFNHTKIVKLLDKKKSK